MCLTSIVANKTSLQLGLPNEYLGSVAHTAPLLLPFPSFPSCPSNHQRSRSTARSGCASRTASCRWTAWDSLGQLGTAWDSLGQLGILDTPGDHWVPLANQLANQLANLADLADLAAVCIVQGLEPLAFPPGCGQPPRMPPQGGQQRSMVQGSHVLDISQLQHAINVQHISTNIRPPPWLFVWQLQCPE